MILVIGGTGTVGGALVRELDCMGAPYRVLVRDVEAARSRLPAGATLVPGDLADPASLVPALDGVAKLFLLSPNSPEQVQLQGNAIASARRCGVQHVVKLSGFQPDRDPSGTVGTWHAATEAQIRDSDIPFTFLQPAFLMQNLLLYAEPVAAGVLPIPSPGGVSASVDARDVSAVAARVLTGSDHEGRTYELTGPAAVSFEACAAALQAATGRPVRHVCPSFEEAAAAFAGLGLPEWLIRYVLSLYRHFAEQPTPRVTNDVTALLGRPARSVEDFANDYAAGFLAAAPAGSQPA